MPLTDYGQALVRWLDDPNIKAFLRVIREGESSQDDDRAYRMRWGGIGKPIAFFEDFNRHPRIFEPGPSGPSSAAGAYQITATTFDDFAPRIGVTDFSPETQDLLAVAIIHSEDALMDIVNGEVTSAILKLGNRWASFPSSTAGQPTVKLQRLLDTFKRYGGVVAGQEPSAQNIGLQQPAGNPPPRPSSQAASPPPAAPTPSPRQPMPIPAIVTAAASALLPIVADLMRARGSMTSERNAEIIEKTAPVLVEVARQIVPEAKNEQEAAEKILGSAQLQTEFKGAVAIRWQDIEPFLQFEAREREAARAFTMQMTGDGPLWRQLGWGALIAILSLLIVGGIGYTFWHVLFSDAPVFSQSTRDGVVELMKNVLILVVGFYFGSSASGRQKDATIADQAKR